MQVIWQIGDATPESVLKQLRRQGRSLSDGSVRKILSILESKGYLSRRPEGRTFRYRADVPKTQANRSMLTDLLNRAFGGSPALMVAALLDNPRVGENEFKEIKRLISKLEKAK